jgi:hypothetical protein
MYEGPRLERVRVERVPRVRDEKGKRRKNLRRVDAVRLGIGDVESGQHLADVL